MGHIETYKNQIDIEKKIIEAAETTVKDIKNLLVRELILGIAKDSEKHINLLSGLIAKTTKPSPLIEEKITDQLAENLQTHITLEQEAITKYKEILEILEDESQKVVIKAIYQDEVRHHALLKKIQKAIVEKETITEDDLWDLIWKDVPFHGTPGG
ncbi:MAG: ferritin-like domain-containing protein [Promethearchaeota archaeon]